MLSPIAWLNATTRTAAREIRKLAANPGELFFCCFLPVVWMLVVWGLLGRGIMTDIPVAFVDSDKTSMTREIGRAFDANRVVGLQSFNTQIEALDAMRKGSVYAAVVIPFGFTRDTLAGRGSSIVLYLDENRYAVAGTIQAELTSTVSTLSLESAATSFMQTGTGAEGARRMIEVVHSDFYALGNMGMNFNAFLGSNLLPGILMLGAMFGFVTSIIREDYQGSISEWFDCSDDSITAALAGKLTPHLVLYGLVLGFYLALFSGFGGWSAAGSLLIWFLLGMMCLSAFACMAILISAIAPTWRFALAVSSGYAAPALPFTGFSIPMDSMGPVLQAFCKSLPLTWFIEGQSQQWILGAEIHDMGSAFGMLSVLVLVPLVIGVPLLKFAYGRRARKRLEEKAKPHQAVPQGGAI